MSKPEDTTRLWPESPDSRDDQTTRLWPDVDQQPSSKGTTQPWPGPVHNPSPRPPKPQQPLPPQSPSPQSTPSGRRRTSSSEDERAVAAVMFILITCVISIVITGLLWGWPSLDPHSPAFFPHWWSYHAVKFAVIESVVIVTFIIIAVRRR